ncbi:hypothetical protein [Actinomadura kijaniata]|uniref:hypothetical protein n=1 Tax=Actinomadura kijaniata TaxID=46161 RepID=UPI00082D4102|nr:hypothetical protein [Actinomadura kijaniata]
MLRAARAAHQARLTGASPALAGFEHLAPQLDPGYRDWLREQAIVVRIWQSQVELDVRVPPRQPLQSCHSVLDLLIGHDLRMPVTINMVAAG